MLDGHVHWDAARALQRLGGDEGLFRDIVQIFLHEAPKHLAGLREALAQRDKDSVECIAHTLKGELSYLGVPGAAHHASKPEDAGRNGDLECAASIRISLEKDVENLLTSMRSALAGNNSDTSLVPSSGAN
jgi:HPt (histidine-containing phosphotransfer) domain-containing protein